MCKVTKIIPLEIDFFWTSLMINKIPTYLIMTMFIHVYISGLVDSTCRPQCKPVLFILARYHGGVGPTVEYLWSVGVTRGPHFSRDSDQITNDPSSGPTQIEKSPVCSLLELYAYICALLLRYNYSICNETIIYYNL